MACGVLHTPQTLIKHFVNNSSPLKLIIIIISGVRLSPLSYCGYHWPIIPSPDDRWWWLWSNWWNEDWQGKPKYSEKTCLIATLSTTNLTWPDLGSKPDRRSGKPVTNRLSCSTDFVSVTWFVYFTRLHFDRPILHPRCVCSVHWNQIAGS
jgi:hypothetical protein